MKIKKYINFINENTGDVWSYGLCCVFGLPEHAKAKEVKDLFEMELEPYEDLFDYDFSGQWNTSGGFNIWLKQQFKPDTQIAKLVSEYDIERLKSDSYDNANGNRVFNQSRNMKKDILQKNESIMDGIIEKMMKKYDGLVIKYRNLPDVVRGLGPTNYHASTIYTELQFSTK
jgi:hypothetical protein